MAGERNYKVIRSFRNSDDGKTYHIGGTVKLVQARAVELRSRRVIGGVAAETPEDKAAKAEVPEAAVVVETPEANVETPETRETPEVKAEVPEATAVVVETPAPVVVAGDLGNTGRRKK